MIRLALLLLGAEFLRRRWLFLACMGAFWVVGGLAIFIDGFDGATYLPVYVLGWLLLAQSLFSLLITGARTGNQKRLHYLRGGAVLALSLLVIAHRPDTELVLAILFGVAFLVGGVLRIASAYVVRFAEWRSGIALGVLELLFALFLLEPYPSHYLGTIAYCIGLALVLAGADLLHLARRVRILPAGTSLVAMLFERDDPLAGAANVAFAPGQASADALTVHVWTALGTSDDPLRRPIVDRYIAAVDKRGKISTGHAALEMLPDVYISLYPAEEIDRSPEDFARILRATAENDQPGRFQPSYAEEAAEWCHSTERVLFHAFDADRLRRFWTAYRVDDTYNLTRRNCSSSVAHALEAALEGVLRHGPRSRGPLPLVRMLASPDLWIAGQLRRRAETMAWTPGLILDYARSLHSIVHPGRRVPWLSMFRIARRTWSHHLRAGRD